MAATAIVFQGVDALCPECRHWFDAKMQDESDDLVCPRPQCEAVLIEDW